MLERYVGKIVSGNLNIAMQVCTDDEREVLLAKIRDFLTSLKKQQYGKHIVMRIDKLLQNAATWVAQVGLLILQSSDSFAELSVCHWHCCL